MLGISQVCPSWCPHWMHQAAGKQREAAAWKVGLRPEPVLCPTPDTFPSGAASRLSVASTAAPLLSQLCPGLPPSGLHGLDDARRGAATASPGGRLTFLGDLCREPLPLRPQDTAAGGPGGLLWASGMPCTELSVQSSARSWLFLALTAALDPRAPSLLPGSLGTRPPTPACPAGRTHSALYPPAAGSLGRAPSSD